MFPGSYVNHDFSPNESQQAKLVLIRVFISYLPIVPHICVSQLDQHCQLTTWEQTSVFESKYKTFHHEKALENVVCEMVYSI